MKEIKAYIHRNRIADVVYALEREGFRNLALVDVKGMAYALSEKEQEFSIEVAERVITEVKLELVCDDTNAARAINVIRENARTGHKHAGWIYVSEIMAAQPIDGE